jgi:superfamily I DNA/RNA helicase
MMDLQQVRPTPEQLKLITIPTPGIRIIRGSAGSGKTTTSLLMLRTALGYLLDVSRGSNESPAIKVKVFSFNRTLAAYIEQLAKSVSQSISAKENEIDIEITTLGKYLKNTISTQSTIIDDRVRENKIMKLGVGISLNPLFLVDEVEYVLGRLERDNLEAYLILERIGRGTVPRVEQALRRKILDEVIYPYIQYKRDNLLIDWNDLAAFASKNVLENIDVAVIDEAQDFSANQLRAIMKQLSPQSFTIIVLDSAQKIYKRGFTWKDVGINDPVSYRLERNYRNTIQIADFATRFINNSEISFDDDATLSDITRITRCGGKPQILEGRFVKQMDHILDYIDRNINLQSQSIVFLHPKGGGWFDFIKRRLDGSGLDYIEISRANHWPNTTANIALSTIHSAKGLEFDFVFIIGLEDEHFFSLESNSEDNNFSSAIRLVFMGITRAKENVIIGYNKNYKPSFLSFFEESTYELIKYDN